MRWIISLEPSSVISTTSLIATYCCISYRKQSFDLCSALTCIGLFFVIIAIWNMLVPCIELIYSIVNDRNEI